jgi:predicted phosphodiesterase
MRCAVIADIHANLPALRAVLADIEAKGGVDEVWSLGDIVGYGPDPRECIEMLQELKAEGVVGNHDLGAVGKLDLSYFNPAAADACRWTAGQLTPADVLYLERLPRTLEKGDFFLVHGSPSSPVLEYVLSTGIAQKNFEFFKAKFCLVGHTHVPAAFKEEKSGSVSVRLTPNIGVVLQRNRMIINPGGLGQPRDGDPRAAYAIYDSEAHILKPYRVPYDVSATQDRMMEVGLPITLVTRLEQGT